MISRDQLEAIVGAGNVCYELTTLEGYAADISFVNHVKPTIVNFS